MVTQKPRLLITVDKELIDCIDDYRFENRIGSRSEAIRLLIKDALSRYKKKSKN